MIEIILSIIVICVLFISLRSKNLSILYPNTANIYLFYFFLIFIPFFSSSFYSSFSNRPGYENLIFGLVFHLFFFIAGFTLGNLLFSNDSKKYHQSPFRVTNKRQENYIRFLTIASVFIFLHQIFTLGEIPIYNLIINSVLTEADVIAREGVFKTNTNPLSILWHWNRSLIIPFLIFYNAILVIKGARSLRVLILLICFMIINNSLDGSLGSIVFVFLGLGFVYYGTKQKINVKSILLLPIVFAYPIIFDFLFANDFNLFNSIERILNRISFDSFDRVLKYYDVYGIDQPFLGGRTNKLHTLLSGKEFFSSSNYIFIKHLPYSKYNYALTGNMNANHIAYMYSDFGNLGVTINSVLIGIITASINKFYFSIPKTPITYSIFVIQILLFFKLSGTNPTSILVGHGSILLIVISALIRHEKTSHTI